ncbi:hypothetical protein CDLVIII_4206 [Clostridium sp. DL-VIII]|uniref:transcriptional regulator n=1 Tax=Clostridium sp. DL-VIII TaxID=641107 RepID=UPI00023B0449|nr:transcriptional regulator [Clostridium sp. DL-VIII]EHJ00733.1 hypothetical protein CDLVIII_4206 [Clostridium sp. DL-VIII]
MIRIYLSRVFGKKDGINQADLARKTGIRPNTILKYKSYIELFAYNFNSIICINLFYNIDKKSLVLQILS